MSPALPAVENMPLLPNLRRLRSGTAGAVFLHRFLEGKPAGSVELESLECYRASMHSMDVLAALDPASLHALHMQDGVLASIKTLAQTFPQIEELVLPHMPTYRMREPQGLVEQARDAVGANYSSKRAYALLDEIAPLFPALRRICHVDVNTGDTAADELLTKSIWWTQSSSFPPARSSTYFHQISSVLLSTHRSYPRLLSINGWKLEEGMDERVFLIRSVTGMQFLGMVAPKARFWLEKEMFGMGFVDPGDESAV